MVHGKFLGSPNRVAPVATNSCGTFRVFMYFAMAALVAAGAARAPRGAMGLFIGPIGIKYGVQRVGPRSGRDLGRRDRPPAGFDQGMRLMSRQDANAAFARTSFLYGGNAAYIEELQ